MFLQLLCLSQALALMGKIDEVLPPPKKKALLHWLLMRQESGFCGRPHKPVDTCYSFWVGSTIKLLGGTEYVNQEENRAFLMKTQHTSSGGFSKWIDVMVSAHFLVCLGLWHLPPFMLAAGPEYQKQNAARALVFMLTCAR